MIELKPGQLVRSRAGRDKGKHYLVLRKLDPKHVLLVDGSSRPLDRPKKKNIAHLQHYERQAEPNQLLEPEGLTDSQVARLMKELMPVSRTPDEEV